MEKKLLVLKLVLEGLGLDLDISSVKKRMEKQKAIYLAQIDGVDLGYRYGWYKKGPYCPKLTSDYYDLDCTTDSDDGTKLIPSISTQLDSVKTNYIENCNRPDGLDVAEWMELLASLHFLKNVSKYDDKKAKKFLAEKKPHLKDYIDCAERVFSENVPA